MVSTPSIVPPNADAVSRMRKEEAVLGTTINAEVMLQKRVFGFSVDSSTSSTTPSHRFLDVVHDVVHRIADLVEE